MRSSVPIRAAATRALAAMVLTAVLACKEAAPSWRKHAFNTQDMSRTASESYLPRRLFQKMTALLKPEGPPGGESKGPLPSVFAPVKIYLVEKNRGILSHGHTEIVFPAGGGELDLHDFVVGKNGSFYFAADFMPDLPESDRHVFFLSHGEERVVGGEKFGAGCHSYFDVTSAFHRAMKTDGYLLNTSAGRHVSALAGTFYFAGVRDGKLYIASLTVKDSTFPKLQCASIKSRPGDETGPDHAGAHDDGDPHETPIGDAHGAIRASGH